VSTEYVHFRIVGFQGLLSKPGAYSRRNEGTNLWQRSKCQSYHDAGDAMEKVLAQLEFMVAFHVPGSTLALDGVIFSIK
jgi:hypothetical protein